MKITEFKQIIKEEIKKLNEAKQNKIFVHKNSLWVASWAYNGTAYPIKSNFFKTYLNSDSSDKEHYDPNIINDLIKNLNDPISSKNKKQLFKIPVYSNIDQSKLFDDDDDYGKVKPDTFIYCVIAKEKSTIINFFKTKAEATSWMRN